MGAPEEIFRLLKGGGESGLGQAALPVTAVYAALKALGFFDKGCLLYTSDAADE